MKKDYIVELREEEADELMNDHWVGELVRCKDCKHGYPLTDSAFYQCTLAFRTSERHERDWFCADGERK